jgi:phage shock protein E
LINPLEEHSMARICLVNRLAFATVAGVLAGTLAGILAPLLSAAAQAPGFVDYAGFLQLAEKVEPYRAGRRVSLDTFNAMKAEPGTIVLDARSARNYAIGHIRGATHLDFTEFSAGDLARVIPDKTTRILIYCNNNFEDDAVPVMLKATPLALNVPTFINLYGYGYTNVYELDGAYTMGDPAIAWETGTYQEN